MPLAQDHKQHRKHRKARSNQRSTHRHGDILQVTVHHRGDAPTHVRPKLRGECTNPNNISEVRLLRRSIRGRVVGGRMVAVVVAFTFGMFFEAEGGNPITAEGGE